MIARLRRLGRDRRAVTAVEFGLIAPTMLMVLMGLGELMYQEYAQAILDGAIQKAARDSSIQGGAEQTAAIDARVIAMIGNIVKNPVNNCSANPPAPSWCSVRKSYDTFAQMKPEDFSDTNHNGVRDPGECFSDVNGNKTWDADPGVAGQGGADDVTIYTITVTYPRLFPVAGMLGWSNTQTIMSKTILKNQPYASQSVTVPVQVCT